MNINIDVYILAIDFTQHLKKKKTTPPPFLYQFILLP